MKELTLKIPDDLWGFIVDVAHELTKEEDLFENGEKPLIEDVIEPMILSILAHALIGKPTKH